MNCAINPQLPVLTSSIQEKYMSNNTPQKHSQRTPRKRSIPAQLRRTWARRIKNNKLKTLGVLLAIVLIFNLAAYIRSGSSIKLTDEGYSHAKRFADNAVINGIDVSEHQGDDINWTKVKSSGVDFVFVRAGYRSAKKGELFEDKYFRQNIKDASKAGLMTGVYFYSQAINADEAVEEANYLLELIKDFDIDLPVVIDYETYPDGRLEKAINSGDMYAAYMYHEIVLSFCRIVKNAGYEPGIYANYNMFTNYMDASMIEDEASLWVAQYGKSTALKANYSFWQCSESAEVGGIEGSVDHNFWYIKPDKAYATRAVNSHKDRVSISECDISFNKENYRLRMHRAEPKVTVQYQGKKLREGRDYEISFVNNTSKGTGYAVIRGINEYKNYMARSFMIK